MLLASALSLTKARFADPSSEKPYLLALPDLSSPRATLQTLITNGDIARRDILANGVPWVPTPAILRMMDTVNVANVTAAGRDFEAAQAAAHLKDVFDHMTLPPIAEIP